MYVCVQHVFLVTCYFTVNSISVPFPLLVKVEILLRNSMLIVAIDLSTTYLRV